MQRGLLPGVLAIANKFVPTMKAVARNSTAQFLQFAQVSTCDRQVRNLLHPTYVTAAHRWNVTLCSAQASLLLLQVRGWQASDCQHLGRTVVLAVPMHAPAWSTM